MRRMNSATMLDTSTKSETNSMKHRSTYEDLIIFAMLIILGYYSSTQQQQQQQLYPNNIYNYESSLAINTLESNLHFEPQFNLNRFDNRDFKILPMEGKTIGANVYGFNPQWLEHKDEKIQQNVVDKIRHALDDHLVLVFHNVTETLTPELHLKFAKLLGPVDPAVSGPPQYLKSGKFNSPDQVKRALASGAKLSDLGSSMLKAAQEGVVPKEMTRIVKNPSDSIAFGEGWHSDLTYLPATPYAALLASREVPKIGGNTHYLDMRAAYDFLPQEIKDQLETYSGSNHTDGDQRWTIHPSVRTDGKNNLKSLFVNKAFARDMVPSNPKLLEYLLDFVEELPEKLPSAFLNLTWSDGQMLIWDNRFTQHAANADYTTRREMHRVVVSGTVPF